MREWTYKREMKVESKLSNQRENIQKSMVLEEKQYMLHVWYLSCFGVIFKIGVEWYHKRGTVTREKLRQYKLFRDLISGTESTKRSRWRLLNWSGYLSSSVQFEKFYPWFGFLPLCNIHYNSKYPSIVFMTLWCYN